MLVRAASSAAPKLRRRAASTRGSVSVAQTPDRPSSQGRTTSATSGRTTIRPSQVRVHPMASGKPGRMLGCFQGALFERKRGFAGEARAAAVTGRASALVDAVEDAAVGEMRRLRLLPAAELVVDRHHRNAPELGPVLRQGVGVARAE